MKDKEKKKADAHPEVQCAMMWASTASINVKKRMDAQQQNASEKTLKDLTTLVHKAARDLEDLDAEAAVAVVNQCHAAATKTGGC